MKFLIILISFFLIYLIVVNILGNYSLVSTYLIHRKTQEGGTNVNLGMSESLHVEVKRARQFYIFPSYIMLPKIYFTNSGLTITSKWEEVRIKTINFWVLIIFILGCGLWAGIETFKYSKHDNYSYEW